MERKYQVFISSTFTDLKEERDELMKVLIHLGHLPIGMEMFNAADEEQWETIKRKIDECDYYVIIVSDRYGSTNKKDGIGFTEKEYDYAKSKNKPILRFIRNQKAIDILPATKRESKNKRKLKQFKKKISEERMCSFWSDKNDLSTKFILSFNQILKLKPQTGWIRNESMSQWSPNRNTKASDNDSISSQYSFLDGYYIGYTIQDCRDYENGEKDEIFPLIAEIKVTGNRIEGYAEIYYRNVGDVQFAKLILSGLVNDDKIEYEWRNEKNPNHTGKMCHTIEDHGIIIGTYSAYGVDKGNPVQGRSVYHKVTLL